MSEDLDISDSRVGILLVDSSIVPESPCVKILDIVDVANDEELILIDNGDPILQCVAPTSSSDTLKFIFCSRKNFFIQIWDVHACQLVGTIDMEYNHVSIPRGWAVTNDGNTFLCARGRTLMSSVELWDIHSSTFIRKLEMGIFYPHLCISPDSRRLAVADSDHHRVHIYDLQTGIIRSSSHAPATPRYPIIVGWSPNSDRVMTYESLGNHTSGVASAIVWQVTDSAVEPVTEPIQLNCAHLLYPRHIMFSGDRIIYLYHEELLIGHLENGHFQVRVQERREDLLGPCALSPDGQMFACITRDHNCMIVDATSGSIIGGPLGNGGNHIHSLCFASNGEELVILSYYASIRVWDVKAALEQYRVAHSQKDANASSAPNEAAASTSTPTASRNAPRARSNSADSSILNLPISDVPVPSVTLSTPTQTPYTRRRERRKPIEHDSLLDLPATDSGAPIIPRSLGAPIKPPPGPQIPGNSANHPVATPTAPAHSQRRARLTALWARIRRRRKPDPTAERESRAHKNESNLIPLRDLPAGPVVASASTSAPAPTEEIVEVAAGRLDDRLIIAPPRKKKRKKLPASPPLQAAENAEVQPTSQSNASSSASSASSSSQTDSDAESIDWLDYICFCMCLPSNKTKKKKRKEKEKAGRQS